MNEHVWVIDDDSAIRWVLDRALSQASIPITAFNTADQALHHLNDEAPLAIITDIRMPGTSGLEFLEKVDGQTEPSRVRLSSSGWRLRRS